MNQVFPLANICSAVSPVAQSVAAHLWFYITSMWPKYWAPIVVVLILWITFEIITRNGTVHYNSANGFSPAFNRFVGSGTYLGLHTVALLVLSAIFGGGVYCLPLPYVIHLLIFLGAGSLLHYTGFWPYLKEPGNRPRRHFRYRRYYHRRVPRSDW